MFVVPADASRVPHRRKWYLHERKDAPAVLCKHRREHQCQRGLVVCRCPPCHAHLAGASIRGGRGERHSKCQTADKGPGTRTMPCVAPCHVTCRETNLGIVFAFGFMGGCLRVCTLVDRSCTDLFPFGACACTRVQDVSELASGTGVVWYTLPLLPAGSKRKSPFRFMARYFGVWHEPLRGQWLCDHVA